jgi:hypothetical protein
MRPISSASANMSKEIPMFDPLIAAADEKVLAAKAAVLGAAVRP